jgi:hypothetical protein
VVVDTNMVMTAGAETILIEEETASVESIVHTIAVEAVMKVRECVYCLDGWMNFSNLFLPVFCSTPVV